MQCYSELTPPTAVTHSLTISLLTARSLNLVVAKSYLIQVITTKSVSEELDHAQDQSADAKGPTIQYDSRVKDDEGLEATFLGGDALLLKSDRANNTKLVLFAEFPLSGTVTGLAKIKTLNTRSGGESILIAFGDARLSLVEWGTERYSLSPVSLHYNEQDELQGRPWSAPLGDYVTFLAADPQR